MSEVGDVPVDPVDQLQETLRARKTWDNTTLRLLIGDAEVQHRSIEAELRRAAATRVEHKAAKRTRRSRRRRGQIDTW